LHQRYAAEQRRRQQQGQPQQAPTSEPEAREPANVAAELERRRQQQGQQASAANGGIEAREPSSGAIHVDPPVTIAVNVDASNPVAEIIVTGNPVEAMRLMAQHEVPEQNENLPPRMVPLIGLVEGEMMELNFGVRLGRMRTDDDADVAGPSNPERIDVDQSAPGSPVHLLCLDRPNYELGEVHRM
jgi:hypothetical protein